MPKITDLNQARQNRNDEFYTMYEDIAKEMCYYTNHFKGKIIYCNCDNPKYSKFYQYFKNNFNTLQLNKLICTYYDPNNPVYVTIFNGNKETKTLLKGNGDYASPECQKYLKQADIIITNPPFSLWRKYISNLLDNNKLFIILGNINSATYREVFPAIVANKVWLGASIHSGDREFSIPAEYPITASIFRQDADGTKYIRVKGVRWFTNLTYNKQIPLLELNKAYKDNPKRYPQYDDYDAINCDKTKDIPNDYYGKIGVPVTFLDKYNPEQFEIIDAINRYSKLTGPTPETKGKYLTKINGKPKYTRLVVKLKKKEVKFKSSK